MLEKLLIGVTGIYASGKSTFCKILQHRGYKVISADEVAKEVIEFPEILEEIRKKFPSDIFSDDGLLKRKVLGRYIFNDKSLMDTLNALMQPKIKEELIRKIDNSGESIVFVEVPLLYEEGYENLFDKVVLISSDRDKVLERGSARDGVRASYVEAALSNQLPLEEKIKRADYTISNDFGFDQLEQNAEKFLAEIQSLLGNSKI